MSPSNTYTGPSATLTNTPTVSPLRHPQTSPRSPLTSVRNIVAAWKERTPLAKPTAKSSVQGSVTSASPPPGEGDSVRRPTEGMRSRAQEGHSAAESRRPEDTSIDMADLIPFTKVISSILLSPFSLRSFLVARSHWLALVPKRPCFAAIQIAAMPGSALPPYAPSFLDCPWRWKGVVSVSLFLGGNNGY
jgi:hypothetical protein